jgi:cytochrome c-type biogenesis protein CcmH
MRWFAVFVALLATPVHAVEPHEILSDPALEARARAISQGLRCLVCRNESIDESNAELAADMRVVLRERITAGDTDEEALSFMVDRYGEYVLLRPTATGSSLILWLAGPAMLLTGAGIAALYMRRRRVPATAGELSSEEKARLKELMGD